MLLPLESKRIYDIALIGGPFSPEQAKEVVNHIMAQ